MVHTADWYIVFSLLQGSTEPDVQVVADKLAKDAHELGQDDEYMSPFATRAESFGLDFKGKF